jgi:hypothetical protein
MAKIDPNKNSGDPGEYYNSKEFSDHIKLADQRFLAQKKHRDNLKTEETVLDVLARGDTLRLDFSNSETTFEKPSNGQTQKKAQADESLPQTFAELFNESEKDLPKLTALLQEFGLLNSKGKWIGSDTGKGRGKLMLVVDALNAENVIQFYSDEVTGELICDYYGTRLGTRSYYNRPADNERLKDTVKGLFSPK